MLSLVGLKLHLIPHQHLSLLIHSKHLENTDEAFFKGSAYLKSAKNTVFTNKKQLVEE